MLLIFSRVINICWFCFKWGLVLGAIGVAAVVAVPYLYQQVDEQIRCRVVERIAGHYPGLKVTVRSAELVDGEGIKVRDLSIVEPGADGPLAELIHVDELRLECATDLQELLGGEPQVTQITIRRPTLRVTRRPDGTWSAAKLRPLPKFSKRPPAVRIENGTIEIFDPLSSPAGTLTLRDVNLTLTPPEISDGPAQTRLARKLRGTLSADHLRRVEVEGWIDSRQAWMIRGSIEGLDLSPELRNSLPGPLAEKLAVLGELRGQGTLGFRLGYDPTAESPYRFGLSGRLVRGRVDDPRLPHPLTDVSARVRLGNGGFAIDGPAVDGFVIDELVARSGPATLWMSARQAGLAQGSPLLLQAKIRQLELDGRLFEILHGPLKDQWRKYRPAGQVNADVNLSFDGQAWHPEILVQCLDVSFTYHKFPYRLEHGTGTVQLKDDVLRVTNLTAYSGSQPVHLEAEVHHPTSSPAGWFEAGGNDLQLDEKLLAALPERSQAVIRSFDPRGTINFHLRTTRDGPNRPLGKHLVVELNRCSVRYQKFPYPLSNIRGTLEMRNDHWTFRDLEATNDTGRVTCEGYMTSPRQGRELFLRFVGTDVPLEEELRDALRPNIRRVWNDLKPRGTVDLEELVVRYLPGRKKLSVSLRARPKGDTTSIEPVHFPYRMEKLQGVLFYSDGHVRLQGLKAEHGPVRMAAAGDCDFLPDGRWNLQIQGLSVDRLRLEDRELVRALPGRLKKAILELNPTGPVHLRGALGLQGGGGAGNPVRSQWNLEIDIHQGSIDCGIKLEQIHGSITLAGGFDGRNFRSRGELALDSLSYKDYQFTQLMGPLWIDDRQVLLGSWVDRRQDNGFPRDPSRPPPKPRPLTARLFGGTVCGDVWTSLGPEPRYGLHATLRQADLSRYAQEVMTGRQDLRGKIMATLDLAGTGRSINGMQGHGKIWLRDADIYELPLMISLLKILSIREPDRSAFSKSDIVFNIQGNHIYFKTIDFNGDAISLLGQGEMDFQSNVRFTFQPILGRNDWHLPGFTELFKGAGKQIMQIQVGGTLQNPETRKDLFPVVNQAQQRLQNDLRKGANSHGLFPQARHLMPHVGGSGGSRR